ncbi:MAG: ribosomal-processing cysteine protease Prp [Firmicutes bacterium]|nr:ribosomal-processing cysteine protease Prp [Bacillota bacterium]
MTKIIITKKQNQYLSIECDGHTGYGAEGEDIVCAAASSIVQTAALGLLQVAKLKPEIKQEDKKGFFSLKLDADSEPGKMRDGQVIFATMLCGLQDLADTYSDYIELEVKDVY